MLEKPGSFGMVDQPEPDAIPPGHARVRVRRVGICGTDWHAYHGRQPFFAYPRVLGHELGVEVEQVNDPSSSLQPGDRCSVEPYLNCGTCIACRRGKGNCCTTLKVLGVHVDGGMRDRIIVPAVKLHRSNQLTLDQLALVETLGIGCHAVARATVESGERALVLGAGPIGLSVLPFLLAAGVEVVVADVSESRLAFCREQMKIAHTLDARGDLVEPLKALPGGDLPTVVIDATGNAGSMARCFDLLAHGGRIVFVGLFQGEVAFNDPNFHRRETTLLASRNARPEDFTQIIGMMERGKIDTTPWITHRCSSDAFLEALPGWVAPDAKLIKAMVEF
jgi:2-desacetyl-2-hydroxyethyl bacteriochlorophyllide A dehydrogenase